MFNSPAQQVDDIPTFLNRYKFTHENDILPVNNYQIYY